MSRIGKRPVAIPKGVKVEIKDRDVVVSGPLGSLARTFPPEVKIEIKEGEATVAAVDESRRARAMWGLCRTLLQNMVQGCSVGYQKQLEVMGTGYRVELAGGGLVLHVGYSAPKKFPSPQGVALTVEKNTVTVKGIDKELVGETAARIRRIKKPEPYKGKGIKYVGETIRRKVGKTGK